MSKAEKYILGKARLDLCINWKASKLPDESYRDAPNDIQPYIEQAIKDNFDKIYNDALKAFRADLKNIAKDAIIEYESIKADLTGV